MTLQTTARLLLLVSLAILAAGCQNSAQTGVVAGAGVGALMGQAIGRNTTATLIGTGVGAGVGYIIGNERDKSRAEDLSRQQAQRIAALESAQNRPAPASAPMSPGTSVAAEVRVTHSEIGGLGGTRWAVVSVNPKESLGSFASMIVEFRNDGRVMTTTTTREGQIRTADESYRVVGDTLIINRPGYIINARFQETPDQLIVSADRFSAVLQRLPG